MDERKIYIRHIMMLEFKNNKNATKAAKIFFSDYGQSVITDRQVKTSFQRFFQVIDHSEINPNQDAHQTSTTKL